jgi:hypothetical protein
LSGIPCQANDPEKRTAHKGGAGPEAPEKQNNSDNINRCISAVTPVNHIDDRFELKCASK